MRSAAEKQIRHKCDWKGSSRKLLIKFRILFVRGNLDGQGMGNGEWHINVAPNNNGLFAVVRRTRDKCEMFQVFLIWLANIVCRADDSWNRCYFKWRTQADPHEMAKGRRCESRKMPKITALISIFIICESNSLENVGRLCKLPLATDFGIPNSGAALLAKLCIIQN